MPLKSRRIRALVAAALAVAILALVRFASSHDGVAQIERIETTLAVELGPDADFFGIGLIGDGSAYAIIALDPLGTDIGRLLNGPAYRYARFGYSWLARVAAGGEDQLVLMGLSIVGFASLAILAYLAALLRDRLGPRSWLLVLSPALTLGVIRDTAEPLALALLALTLYSGSWLGSLGVAVVRPSYLLGLAGRWKVFLIGLGAALISRSMWITHFGSSAFEGANNFALPLLGYFREPHLVSWAVLTAAAVTSVIGVLSRDWGWVLGGFFVLTFSEAVVPPVHALRASGFLFVLWAFGPNWAPVSPNSSSHKTVHQPSGA